MVAAQYFGSHEAIDNRWNQSSGRNEIVQTPADILDAGVAPVRPKCVRLLDARMQITECVSEA